MMIRSWSQLALVLVLIAACLTGCACGDDDDNDNDAPPTDDDAADDDDNDDDNDADDDDDESPDDDDDNDDESPDDDDDNDDESPDDDDDNDDDNDDSSPEPNELVDLGKWWLHLGDGDHADLYFRQALGAVPNHPEANYGPVLGNALHTLDVISVLVDYVYSILDNGGPVKDIPPDDLLDAFLQEALNGLLAQNAAEQLAYGEICLDHGYAFHQDDTIPIILHFELLAEVAGDFHDAEIHAALAPTLVLLGILTQLNAVSLDFDYTMAYPIIDLDWNDLIPALKTTVDIVLQILNDPQYPQFLTLPPENVPALQESALQWADGLDRLPLAFAAIEAQTGDQTGNVLGYDDLDEDGEYDEGEPYIIPGLGTLDADGMAAAAAVIDVAEKLRNSLWDDTEFDLDPNTRSPFKLSYLNPLLALAGVSFQIPDLDFLAIDFGALYADPGTDGFKQTLIQILEIVKIILDGLPLQA